MTASNITLPGEGEDVATETIVGGPHDGDKTQGCQLWAMDADGNPVQVVVGVGGALKVTTEDDAPGIFKTAAWWAQAAGNDSLLMRDRKGGQDAWPADYRGELLELAEPVADSIVSGSCFVKPTTLDTDPDDPDDPDNGAWHPPLDLTGGWDMRVFSEPIGVPHTVTPTTVNQDYALVQGAHVGATDEVDAALGVRISPDSDYGKIITLFIESDTTNHYTMWGTENLIDQTKPHGIRYVMEIGDSDYTETVYWRPSLDSPWIFVDSATTSGTPLIASNGHPLRLGYCRGRYRHAEVRDLSGTILTQFDPDNLDPAWTIPDAGLLVPFGADEMWAVTPSLWHETDSPHAIPGTTDWAMVLDITPRAAEPGGWQVAIGDPATIGTGAAPGVALIDGHNYGLGQACIASDGDSVLILDHLDITLDVRQQIIVNIDRTAETLQVLVDGAEVGVGSIAGWGTIAGGIRWANMPSNGTYPFYRGAFHDAVIPASA